MNCFLIAALTTDGFIGRKSDDRSFNWTSTADKEFYVDQIKSADVIVMGSKTFETFRKHPRDSRWEVYTKYPQKFVNKKPEIIQASGTDESPKELLDRLEKEGVNNVVIAGGSSIYTMFMQAGVVDKLYLTVEPILFGDGVKLFNQDLDIKLKLESTKQLSEQTILLEYLVSN
jgi:dihydrofolate reductase